MYKSILRPLLFLAEPEKAHHLTFKLLKIAGKLPLVPTLLKVNYKVQHPALAQELFGIRFENPIGLAAGLDKNAWATDELSYLGFGFIEIGTVTPLPQPGNPTPRLFRLPADRALINRMGFNNEGMQVVAERLKKRKQRILIGGNIGKNKITANEDAISDYIKCFNTLYDTVDYFVINVSSPNTPGLRALQEKEPLTALIISLQAANKQKPKSKPILLKIAPDLNEQELSDIVEIAKTTELNGIIATNTTISRANLTTPAEQIEAIGAGGLSGAPVKNKSTEVLRFLRTHLSIPLIASGGIMSVDDALEKLAAGADLIQLYTGFIYEGPALIKDINKAILKQRLQNNPA